MKKPLANKTKQRALASRRTNSAARSHQAPRRRRRNPDETEQAAELYEKFHGEPADKVTEIEEIQVDRDMLADLGRLIELQVFTDDEHLATLSFKGVRLGSSPDGGQLYFVGGEQALDLEGLGISDALPKDFVNVGEAYKIAYHTSKAFHNFEPKDYEHEFGEESGVCPTLGYDTLNRRLFLVGGNYQVRPEGIVD